MREGDETIDFGRMARFVLRHPPWATIALVAVLIAGFVILHGQPDAVESWGMVPHSRFRAADSYRFVTHALVHIELEHLIGNLLFLLVAGLLMEWTMGSWWMIGTFWLGCVAVSLVLVQQEVFSIGASDGIHAALAAPLPVFFGRKDLNGRRIFGALLAFNVIALFSQHTFDANVSTASHFVGAAVGLGVGLCFRRWAREREAPG